MSSPTPRWMGNCRATLRVVGCRRLKKGSAALGDDWKGREQGGQRGRKTGRARESKKLSGSAGLGVRRGSGELGQNSSGIGCANKLGTSFGICWSAFPPFYAQN